MRKKLLINSISGGAQLIIATILILAVVPIFINQLGIEKYGVFSLVLIINNFSIFLGLGVNSSLLKFLSEQGKDRESDTDLIVSYSLLSASYLPFAVIAYIFNKPILQMLGLPDHLITADTIWLFKFLLIANFFQFLVQIPVTILDSLQKIYLTNLYSSVYQIIYWLLILISITFFGSLAALGFSVLLSVIIWFTAVFFTAHKFWGKISFNFNKKDFIFSIKKQLSYSYKLFLSSAINFFYEPFTKVLIATFIGVAEVGYFEIILRIRTQIWNILTKFLYPIFPYISGMKEKSAIRVIIHDVEQKLTYVIIFLITTIIYTGSDFLLIWLKLDNSVVSDIMISIVAANLLAIIFMPLYQFLVLKGYPGKTIILQSVNVFVNSAIFLVLYNIIGFYAVALGTISAVFFSSSLCLMYQKKYLDSMVFDNLRQLYNTLKLLSLLLVSGYIIDFLIIDPLLELIILPLVLLFLTIFFIRILQIITRTDILRYAGNSTLIRDFLIKIFLPAGRNAG